MDPTKPPAADPPKPAHVPDPTCKLDLSTYQSLPERNGCDAMGRPYPKIEARKPTHRRRR